MSETDRPKEMKNKIKQQDKQWSNKIKKTNVVCLIDV